MENSKLMIAIDLLVVVYIYLLVSVSFFRVYSIYVKIMWGGIRGENCLCPETTKTIFAFCIHSPPPFIPPTFFFFYSTKSLMMQYTPEDRQKAIDEYISNSGLLYRQLSEKYHVPVTTIRDGVHGAKQPAICHENQQCLTNDQEEILADWIIELIEQDEPPTHQLILETAKDLARCTERDPPTNVEWVRRFLKRTKLDCFDNVQLRVFAKRRAIEEEVICDWFDLFKKICEKRGIKRENIYSFDEISIQIGRNTNDYVNFANDKKRNSVTENCNKEMATVIEAVSANGVSIRPVVIFKSEYRMTNRVLSNQRPKWFYTNSNSGWTSNYIALAWLKEVFIPQTQPDNPDEFRLLICDGNSSHADDLFMKTCIENKIDALYLPTYSSYLTKLMGLICFDKLKKTYKKLVSDQQQKNGIYEITKDEFLKIYEMARNYEMSKQNIESAWEVAGLFPFCPNKVLKSSSTIDKENSEENAIEGKSRVSTDANVSPRRKFMRQFNLSPSTYQSPRYKNKKMIGYNDAYKVIKGLVTQLETKNKKIKQLRLKLHHGIDIDIDN